jgi:universal stress protein A
METLQQIETTFPPGAAVPAWDPVITISPSVIHLKNILVPLDFSEMSLKSLQYAVPFATQFGAKLTLLHVEEPSGDQADFAYSPMLGVAHFEIIEKRLKDIRAEKLPPELHVDTVVRHNFVFDGILEVAREIRADLIITTTHGYSGLKHLMMGSTAENIVRRAPYPVLVVRELEHDFV